MGHPYFRLLLLYVPYCTLVQVIMPGNVGTTFPTFEHIQEVDLLVVRQSSFQAANGRHLWVSHKQHKTWIHTKSPAAILNVNSRIGGGVMKTHFLLLLLLHAVGRNCVIVFFNGL